jgi:RHS repeat-associated protein
MDKTPETKPKQSPGETSLSEAKLAPVSLPKGGGAIRGMGEKFSVNPATGTGKLDVPIATSPGRQGFGPKLSLSYDSGVGNGLFGAGWSLSVATISRKTDKGLPRYNDNEFGVDADTFLWSGAEDLVPASRKNASDEWEPDTRTVTENGTNYAVRRYMPRTEGSFARIERWDKADGDIHWRVTSRDNTTEIFGQNPAARIADPEHSWKIFSWLLQETRDDRGDIAKFEYVQEDLVGTNPAAPHERNRSGTQAQRHPKRILYGNKTPFVASDFVFEVVFDYGDHSEASPTPTPDKSWPERLDSFSSARSGFEVRTRRLCKRVFMFHRFAELGTNPVLVRSTAFTYAASPDLTHLVKVVAKGHIAGQPDQSMPALEFEYSIPAMDSAVQIAQTPTLPEGIDGSRLQWVDLDGDGIPGVLAPHADAWYYAPNLGQGKFGSLRELPNQPSLAQSPSARLVDISGEGKMALSEFAGATPGFVERRDPRDSTSSVRPEEPQASRRVDGGLATPQPDWSPFQAFAQVPMVDWSSPHVHQIDLDGDGFPDLLITESEAFAWHPSLGRKGYAASRKLPNPGLFDEEKGPRFLIGSATESIHLADLSGDGLADIVRIRNGEICYWPNLGYGKFGAKVTMDHSPVFDASDAFSPSRIRIADLDGTGLADILYLESGRVRFWRNLSGNAWSSAVEVPAFPKFDNLSSVQVTDFLGTGTACLVWSSPLPGEAHAPLRYVDLMGSKPHLLIKTKNNLGAQTHLQYASSTKFFLADREAGKPWATRLPFPVHVVEQSETTETTTATRMVSRYAYHHGYWDGGEREFRGFAHVQQWDAESWTGTDGDPDQILSRPPVRTETWLHTGAWFAADSLMARLRTEWFQGDAKAWPLPDCEISLDLTPEEQREAVRALRGRTLRQEVYAEDGSSKAGVPYSVTEQSHVAVIVQPRTTALVQKYAIFLAHDREKRSSHYERDATDPRVQQELTLRVDSFGTPLRVAAVGYPRRNPSAPAKGEQSAHHITVTYNQVAHQVDPTGPHRIAVPLQTRTFELTGIDLPSNRPFRAAELDKAFMDATPIAYEASATGTTKERREIESKRVDYYDDNLSDVPLAFGDVGTLALPFQTWVAAFTPAMLANVYGTRLDDAQLTAAGYKLFPSTPSSIWWAASARIVHDKTKFLLPVGSIDPWGSTSSQTWDSYGLLVTSSTDALGNTVSVKNHYRTLSPWWITDPNDNHTAARFDALGRVTSTFVLGKSTATGYEADFVDATSTESSATDEPTSTIAYDLTTLPVRVKTRARELHKSAVGGATTRWQESWLYTDGLGREILTKVQAEPGDAFAHDATGALLRKSDGTPLIQKATNRWVGTGRKVYDNKGNVVKRYEPYFTDTPGFDSESELVETGVSAILRYDPVNRPIRTDLPDGTFTKVEFTPWTQSTWDANDTVLQSAWYAARQNSTDPAQKRAAQLAATHANTPTVAHLDTLGRTVVVVTQSDATTFQTTRSTLDLEGNLLRQEVSKDTSTTLTVLTQTFDILGRVCMARNPDSGAKLIWRDVASATLRSWDQPNTTDERSQTFTYDVLRRPLTRSVTANGSTYVAEMTTYGESLVDAKARNARCQAYSHKDGAGIATDEQRDFHGKVTKSVRQLTSDAKTIPDWSKTVGVDETFTTTTAYDALGRVIQIDTPHNTSVPASQVYPIYNEANLLDRVEANLRGATTRTTFVQNIDYDAKGQRQRITYGNGATTDYGYDPLTYRLIQLVTTRPPSKKPDPQPEDGTLLQKLTYTYDATGNVVEIADAAQEAIYFKNQIVKATAQYEYDALYRLISATGREHDSNGAATEPEREGYNAPQNLLSDGQSLRNYTREWTYDHVGNILSLVHTANASSTSSGSWSRAYAYATDSNRLASTTVNKTTQTYSHNAHGSFTSMPHLDAMEWTADEHLQKITRSTSQTWYTYDSTGQRVRKFTDKGGITEERLYLGGWEIYRKRQGATITLERETLHLMDGARRIALVETKTVDTSAALPLPSTVTRYQLDNHLQSATLELDETASVISYEEYYPYGDTSYRSARSGVEVSEKRYRYTGKEKDEESGLYYHGARYYAAWLGRWTAADPAGMVDGACLYAYVRNHPTGLVDPDGRAGVDPEVIKQTGMRMLNDQINTVTNFLSELPFGGHGKANVAANKMEWRGPQGGVGGVLGGGVRTASMRLIPMENNPTDASRFGMELGASVVPILDPAERLVSGQTVSGQEANRTVAGLELAVSLLPLARAKLPSPSIGVKSEALATKTRLPSPGMQADMAGPEAFGKSLEIPKATSGVDLSVTPSKTTTILGSFRTDMKRIIDATGNVKSLDFGQKPGGYNILNTPDELYKTPSQFWGDFNEPFLQQAVGRKDIFKLATEPKFGETSPLFRANESTGKLELSGFGKEYLYLKKQGLSYEPASMQMVFPSIK